MAVAARRDTRMRVAEYRDWAATRPDDERWELIEGVPVLMSPAKGRHQRIVTNLVKHLDDHGHIWKSEGIVVYVYDDDYGHGLAPLYESAAPGRGDWFITMDKTEYGHSFSDHDQHVRSLHS